MEEHTPVASVPAPQPVDEPKSKSRTALRIATACIILAVIAIPFFISRSSSLQKTVGPSASPYPAIGSNAVKPKEVLPPHPIVADRNLPWVEPSLPEGANIVQGIPFTVTLTAHSGDRDVTGYDLLVAFDTAQFELVSIASLVDQYQIYQYERGSHLAVTGIKKLEEKNPIIFDNTPILKLTLKAKKSGKGVVSVLPTEGKEKTQFVDAQVQPFAPQAGSVEVSVQ